jgi:molybdenum cofactor cytidylyltransferase
MLADLGGQPLLRYAVTAMSRAGVQPVIVVVPAEPDLGSALHGMDVQVVINYQAATGIASSIRAGLHAVPPTAGAVLIVLGDQPTISPGHLMQIVEHHARAGLPVTASDYAGVLAPPAIFDRSIFPELLRLSGVRGARPILDDDPARVSRVPVSQQPDVDTPEDLRRLHGQPGDGAS